jgi:hypothetical protein
MIIVALPYSNQGWMSVEEVVGGSPYAGVALHLWITVAGTELLHDWGLMLHLLDRCRSQILVSSNHVTARIISSFGAAYDFSIPHRIIGARSKLNEAVRL